jgi:dienelactone hydrolase
VIVYSGGWYNRSPDNAVLSEYLASYGYVVVAVPLFGEGLVTGNLQSTPDALETQVRDIAAATDAVVEHSWVDGTRIASMGFSSGGIVAINLAGRDRRIDAVIGLDPSYSGEPGKVLNSAGFYADRLKTPILTLRSGNPLFTRRDRSVLVDTLVHADRYTADVGRGSHGDFSDDVVIESTLSLRRAGEPRTTTEGVEAYRASATAVRWFLDGVLRGDAAALERLATGTPVLRMSVSRAQGSDPSWGQ